MADELTDMDASDKKVKLNKPMLSKGIYLGFMLFGALVSLALFLAVQSITIGILGNDYRRISLETSEMVAKEFSELEFSIRTISTLLALSDEADSRKVVEKLDNVEASLEPFEMLLWLHKSEGEWDLVPLYEDLFQVNANDYSNVLKDPEIQKAIRSALRKPDELFMVSNVTNYTSTQNEIFSLVKATETSGGSDSVIMAFTHLVLRNAGHHELANEIEILWEKGKLKKGKK